MIGAALKRSARAAIVCAAASALGGCQAARPAPDAATEPPVLAAQAATEPLIPIRITGFECGDNCYLSYRVTAAIGTAPTGAPQTALCRIDACAAWFEQQAMPPRFTGRSARIALGKGQQVDNAGNVMRADFPEIKTLVLDPAA